ncbi:TetR/AcrR family transcriptional regulator [Candidatus Dojkabacteria bacterium]|nr:TetR/AcrR family transcriptional regulator [Candidatus Dojkabacteria bacterium]
MRNKELTRKKIIKTATKLFVKDGFLKVSTLDIAKKSEIAHGTVFFHFSNRSDLIVSCIYDVMGKLADELNEKSRNSEDVEELCEIFLKQIFNYKKFYSRLIKDIPHLPIKVQRMVFASMSAFSIHLVDTIENAQKNGNIRKFDPKYAMFFWFGTINYIFTYSEMLGTEEFNENNKKELIRFFMASLRNTNY